MSRQHPSQQDHGPFYASDATLSFTTNREEPLIDVQAGGRLESSSGWDGVGVGVRILLRTMTRD